MSQDYLQVIKEVYAQDINSCNYKQVIREMLAWPTQTKEYLEKYMENNIIDFNWGVLFYLLIRKDIEGKYIEIKDLYQKLKKYPPSYFNEYIMAKVLFRFEGNLLLARKKYLTALNLKIDDGLCYYELGFLTYLLGDFATAYTYYLKAVTNASSVSKVKETKVKSLYNLAFLEFKINSNLQKAKNFLKEALGLIPDYTQAEVLLEKIMIMEMEGGV